MNQQRAAVRFVSDRGGLVTIRLVKQSRGQFSSFSLREWVNREFTEFAFHFLQGRTNGLAAPSPRR